MNAAARPGCAWLQAQLYRVSAGRVSELLPGEETPVPTPPSRPWHLGQQDCPVMGWEQREEPLGGVAIALPTESPKGSLGESKL